MKILKKISKVIVIVMAVLATIWCGLYVYVEKLQKECILLGMSVC